MAEENSNEQSRLAARNALRRRGLFLVWVGLIWNVLEAGVALWSGQRADSVALVAFGLDSLIELFAGGVLIWHLRHEWKGSAEIASGRTAERLLGVTFFLLSIYILVQSLGTLLGWFAEPQESIVGMGLVIASAVVMTAIYFPKVSIAKKLGSRALRLEAIESLVCDLQDLTVLVGLGLNTLWGWWWADPLAALALIPFLLKEGWEAFSEGAEHNGA